VPQAIFKLIGESPSQVEQYEPYRSEDVKEKAYRWDGILLPKHTHLPITFVEIQVARDVFLYRRW